MRPVMIARGDSIFHGMLGGGSCSGCHGVGGKGVPGLTPDMTSGKWLHGDGGYAFIVAIVEQGVSHSKQTTGMMPPKGGATLEHADVRAVAAYVYSLTHQKARSGP
jgi:mono/diheme cytochrome c family protein